MDKDFETTLSEAGIKYSMEVIEKSTATVLGVGEVPYYTIRYTFIDSNGNKVVQDGCTWRPESMALAFLQVEQRVASRDENTLANLSALAPGEKIGTITPEDEKLVDAKSEPGFFSTVWAAIVSFFTPSTGE